MSKKTVFLDCIFFFCLSSPPLYHLFNAIEELGPRCKVTSNIDWLACEYFEVY